MSGGGVPVSLYLKLRDFPTVGQPFYWAGTCLRSAGIPVYPRKVKRLCRSIVEFSPEIVGPANVGYGDGTPDHQTNRHNLVKFFIGHAVLLGSYGVIGYAVITSQNNGSHQAKELLGFGIQNVVTINRGVNSEKTLYVDVFTRKNMGVESFPFFLEFLDLIGHILLHSLLNQDRLNYVETNLTNSGGNVKQIHSARTV